jgi:hypothetical protein
LNIEQVRTIDGCSLGMIWYNKQSQMMVAAHQLNGDHDFVAFQASGCVSTVTRQTLSLSVHQTQFRPTSLLRSPRIELPSSQQYSNERFYRFFFIVAPVYFILFYIYWLSVLF